VNVPRKAMIGLKGQPGKNNKVVNEAILLKTDTVWHWQGRCRP